MTRGKYASAAERRREMESLQSRAASAEAARDRLAKELEEVTSRREREVADLRVTLAEVRGQRDQGAAPRITDLEAVNNRLRAERDDALLTYKQYWDQMNAGADRLAAALARHFNLGVRECSELVTAAWFGADAEERWVDPPVQRAIQRARGRRKHDDLSAIVSQAQPAKLPHNRREKEAEIAKRRRELIEMQLRENEMGSAQ